MGAERKAFADALAILGPRDHTEAELYRKLETRGVTPALAEAVIVRLKEQGYLDDRRYAMRWAECAVAAGRGYGPRISFELYRRGISRDVIGEVLSAIAVHHDEMEVLAALMERKFPGFDPKGATDREKRRVLGFLQRRGFSGTLIRQLFQDRQCDT